MDVKVDVEYCGKCNFKSQCFELMTAVQAVYPDAQWSCHHGRQGSFEVKINETLVHSKLASLAFPATGDVLDNVKNARAGQPVTKCREQPITECVIQ